MFEFARSRDRDRPTGSRRPQVEPLEGRLLLSAFERHPSIVAEVQGVGETGAVTPTSSARV